MKDRVNVDIRGDLKVFYDNFLKNERLGIKYKKNTNFLVKEILQSIYKKNKILQGFGLNYQLIEYDQTENSFMIPDIKYENDKPVLDLKKTFKVRIDLETQKPKPLLQCNVPNLSRCDGATNLDTICIHKVIALICYEILYLYQESNGLTMSVVNYQSSEYLNNKGDYNQIKEQVIDDIYYKIYHLLDNQIQIFQKFSLSELSNLDDKITRLKKGEEIYLNEEESKNLFQCLFKTPDQYIGTTELAPSQFQNHIRYVLQEQKQILDVIKSRMPDLLYQDHNQINQRLKHTRILINNEKTLEEDFLYNEKKFEEFIKFHEDNNIELKCVDEKIARRELKNAKKRIDRMFQKKINQETLSFGLWKNHYCVLFNYKQSDKRNIRDNKISRTVSFSHKNLLINNDVYKVYDQFADNLMKKIADKEKEEEEKKSNNHIEKDLEGENKGPKHTDDNRIFDIRKQYEEWKKIKDVNTYYDKNILDVFPDLIDRKRRLDKTINFILDIIVPRYGDTHSIEINTKILDTSLLGYEGIHLSFLGYDTSINLIHPELDNVTNHILSNYFKKKRISGEQIFGEKIIFEQPNNYDIKEFRIKETTKNRNNESSNKKIKYLKDPWSILKFAEHEKFHVVIALGNIMSHIDKGLDDFKENLRSISKIMMSGGTLIFDARNPVMLKKILDSKRSNISGNSLNLYSDYMFYGNEKVQLTPKSMVSINKIDKIKMELMFKDELYPKYSYYYIFNFKIDDIIRSLEKIEEFDLNTLEIFQDYNTSKKISFSKFQNIDCFIDRYKKEFSNNLYDTFVIKKGNNIISK